MYPLNKKTISIFIIILTFAWSCKKEDTSTATTGSLKLEIEHLANDTTLKLGKEYTNPSGEKMIFSKFDYYISNIILTKTDGTTYVVPRDSSYHLIQFDGLANPIITLKNVPFGDYNKVTFTIGVDSLKNTEDVTMRPGDLDISKGMYWSWNSGYIFLKAEGTYNSDTSKKFKYHIGLYGNSASGGGVNNIKTVTLASINDYATVRSNIIPQIHLSAEVMELFKTPNTFSVTTTPMIMASPNSKLIADNYSDMFLLEHIHN